MKKDANLKNKVFSGVIWRFFERCGAQFVSFIVSIILARILLPEAYGTVAILSVFIELFQVFVDCGLGNALVQKKDSDSLDFSSVFFFNLVICIIIYLLLWLVAPKLALFYNNLELTPLLRTLGLIIIVSGLKSVQQAYVSKNMLFKRFFFSTILGTILAAIVGIWLATNGYGVWALVFQQLTNITIDTFVLWITVKWHPVLKFSYVRLKALLNYGWKFLISSLLDTGCRNLWQLFIGKKYNSGNLAYYNKGNNWPNLIVANINTAIDSVLLPAMALQQDEPLQVKRIVKKSIMVSCYVIFPMMFGLIAIAKPLTILLLTDKWLPSVKYLQLFCIEYMMYPIHTANLNELKAIGRSDLFLKLEVIKKIISISALIISIKFGIFVIAVTSVLVSIISTYINAFYSKRFIGYSYLEQIKDIWDVLILSGSMCLIVYIESLFVKNNIFLLIFQIITGIVIYLIGSVLFKIEGYVFLKKLIMERKGSI